MFTKQGNSRNKVNIKRLTVYALFIAICLIVGYLENFLSITVIAGIPGVKLGLSNALVLILLYNRDVKGAWMVNLARIALSALLFGSPISFLFSLSGGVTSLTLAHVLSRLKSVSVIGVSISCAVAHNVFQLLAACLFMGVSVAYYAPVLIAFGAICGLLCGIFAQLILSKVNDGRMFRY